MIHSNIICYTNKGFLGLYTKRLNISIDSVAIERKSALLLLKKYMICQSHICAIVREILLLNDPKRYYVFLN